MSLTCIRLIVDVKSACVFFLFFFLNSIRINVIASLLILSGYLDNTQIILTPNRT